MEKSKPIPQIEVLRQQYKYNRKQVLWLTCMTESQLMQLMYNTGLEWLTNYFNDEKNCDEATVRQLLSQPLIWKWWENEWNRRDDKNLPCLYELYRRSKNEVLAVYRQLHQETFIKYTPPYILLSKGYDATIDSLINEIHKSK